MEAPKSADTPESTPSSFFGSPTEPIYSDHKQTLSADLLQDTLVLLASKNDLAVSTIQESDAERKKDECMHFSSGHPILFLFELCRHFKLAPEVQYRAAELFHRFMLSHVIELYQVNPSMTSTVNSLTVVVLIARNSKSDNK